MSDILKDEGEKMEIEKIRKYCVIGFIMSFGFNKDISLMGQESKEEI